MAQTRLVGGWATASDLAATLITKTNGTVSGLSSGKIEERSCSIEIDSFGLVSVIGPALDSNSEFTGQAITNSAKLDGDGGEAVVDAGPSLLTISAANVPIGESLVTVYVDKQTQLTEYALSNGLFCKVAAKL